jgi:hypothetical protein
MRHLRGILPQGHAGELQQDRIRALLEAESMSKFIWLEDREMVINLDLITAISISKKCVYFTGGLDDYVHVTEDDMAKLLKEVGCDE